LSGAAYGDSFALDRGETVVGEADEPAGKQWGTKAEQAEPDVHPDIIAWHA